VSTGLECEFVRRADDKWFYALQDGDCPVQCWDWHEYATAYGPFESFDKAHDHLRDNHANPGGYSIDENKEGKPLGESWDEMIQYVGTSKRREDERRYFEVELAKMKKREETNKKRAATRARNAQNRVSKGTPKGGQFSASRKPDGGSL
jgi:hypothetical protein